MEEGEKPPEQVLTFVPFPQAGLLDRTASFIAPLKFPGAHWFVISNAEEAESTREHRLGTLTTFFKIPPNNNRLVINSIGEGAVMVSNINGNLENGDYITTSAIEGLGMKQDDDLLHNYTVAKITQDCDFSSDTTDVIHDGQTYKMKLVGCTYHCG